MKKNFLTYLLSLFFIMLLFAKDIAAVFPSFFSGNAEQIALQSEWPEEESGNNKTTEIAKNNSTEYLDKIHCYSLSVPIILLSINNNLPENDSFKQTFYGTVLTPPPDKF